MSINFCTLTNSSVDTFCGNRRSIVLGNLIAEKYPAPFVGTNNQGIRDTFAQLRPDLVRHVEVDDRPPIAFEQPFITVEVWMDGVRMAETQESTQQLDFVSITDVVIGESKPMQEAVSITDFVIGEPMSEAVNISDITIRQL